MLTIVENYVRSGHRSKLPKSCDTLVPIAKKEFTEELVHVSVDRDCGNSIVEKVYSVLISPH